MFRRNFPYLKIIKLGGFAMLRSIQLQVEQSEIRQRINAALGKEEMGDDERGELDKLTKRAQELEIELRAALVSDAAVTDTRIVADDGEGRELRGILSSVSISDYLSPATAGQGLSGRALDLNQALGLPIVGASGATPVPWAVLLEKRDAREELEKRAFTDTGDYAGGVGQRPILQRLFGPGIMDALGVRIDSVPMGRTEWPLISGGVAPNMKAEGTAADAAVAATFATETLKPKRLTGRYEFTHEMASQVVDLEAALRRDLGDAVMAQMSNLALNGDESTNAHEPDGFFRKLTAPDVPGAVATFADYAGSHATAVDGIHAMMEGEVSSVIGVESYQHAATVYQAGSGESGSEALKRRSMACAASSYVPNAPTSGARQDVQDNIYHAAGQNGGAMMRGDSVAAIWPTLEIIRDIYTQASQGVVLTWVGLWDLEAAFRSAAYGRIAFKVR